MTTLGEDQDPGSAWLAELNLLDSWDRPDREELLQLVDSLVTREEEIADEFGGAGPEVPAPSWISDEQPDFTPRPGLPAETLAAMAPDGDLVAELEHVDLTEVDEYYLVEMAAAWQRIASWAAARLVHVAGELAVRPLLNDDGALPDHVSAGSMAADEMAPRLGLSRFAARRIVRDAQAFSGTFDRTGHALATGHIDARKASTIVSMLEEYPAEVAVLVQDAVLDAAGLQTHSQLVAAIRKAVIAVTHDEADRLHARARAKRRVDHPRQLPDGMASMLAVLPATDAAALDLALEAAARTARANGDQRTLDQLRADTLSLMGHAALETGYVGLPPGVVPGSGPAGEPGSPSDGPEERHEPGAATAGGPTGAPQGGPVHGRSTDPPAPLTAPPEPPPPPTEPAAKTAPPPSTAGDGDRILPADESAADMASSTDPPEHPPPPTAPPEHPPSPTGPAAATAQPSRADMGDDGVTPPAATATGPAPPTDEGTALSTAHSQAGASTDRRSQVGTPDSPAPSTSDPDEPGLPSPGTGAGVPARWCMTVGQIGGRRTQVRVTVPLSVLLPPDIARQLGLPPTGGDDQDRTQAELARLPDDDAIILFLEREPAEVAELEGYGPISPAVARAAALGGTWQRLVTDPLTGIILDHSRSRYRPPADLAELVRLRDGTCVEPGCSSPARSCELDHVQAWSQGGTTALLNLGDLCTRGHLVKTSDRFRLRHLGAGEFEWTTPTGHVYHRRRGGRVVRVPRDRSWAVGPPPF